MLHVTLPCIVQGSTRVDRDTFACLSADFSSHSHLTTPMVVSRALKRSLAPKALTLQAVECLTPAENGAPHKKFSVPLLPLLFLFFSGLVAARLLPEVSSGVSIAPSLTTDVFPRPPSAVLDVSPQPASQRANFSEPAFRCQSWCLSRVAPISHVSSVEHCYAQCLAHPEVMGFIPALEASALAPSGVNTRNLLFAAWYAEGERGSEVSFCFCPVGQSLSCRSGFRACMLLHSFWPRALPCDSVQSHPAH